MRFCKVFSKVQHVSNVLWAQTGVCSSRRAGAGGPARGTPATSKDVQI